MLQIISSPMDACGDDMNANAKPLPLEEAVVIDEGKSQAVAALHLAALQRQFAAIREIYGEDPPHRAREALWVGLEVIQAELRGERLALRDLVTRADGLLSAPTLSRVVVELEQRGLLVSEQVSSTQGRLKLLRPTPAALNFIAARADVAFAEFAAIIREAERS
jgi:DNA-binding MarR family transcriptional regulator